MSAITINYVEKSKESEDNFEEKSEKWEDEYFEENEDEDEDEESEEIPKPKPKLRATKVKPKKEPKPNLNDIIPMNSNNTDIYVKYVPIVHSYSENIKRNARTILLSKYIDMLKNLNNNLLYSDPNNILNLTDSYKTFEIYKLYDFLTTPIKELPESVPIHDLINYYDSKYNYKINDLIKTYKIISIRYGNIELSYNNNLYKINTKNHKITPSLLYSKRRINKKYKWIMNSTLQKDVSLYEILDLYTPTKLYFDIENINCNEKDFIYNIIRDLKIFVKSTTITDKNPNGIELTDYVLTFNNESSSHDGLSYHLIFNHYFSRPIGIKSLVLNFIEKYPIYADYIDVVVYSKNRLFKSVNQLGIDGNINNKHVLVKGNIEDSIIQNIKNCKEFDYNYTIPESMKTYKSNKHSWNKDNKNEIMESVKEVIKETFKDLKITQDENNYTAIFKERKEPILNVDEIYGIALGLKMKDLNEKQNKYIDKLVEDYNKNKLKDYNLVIVKSILGTF